MVSRIMATYTEVLNTNYNYENINIFNVTNDETQEVISYRARPCDGYVMYDVNANDTELIPNPETGELEEIAVTYYRTVIVIPKTYNFNNFHWAAVLRSTVDENYIFGGGDNNNHETM